MTSSKAPYSLPVKSTCSGEDQKLLHIYTLAKILNIFLIYVEYFIGWIEACPTKTEKSSDVAKPWNTTKSLNSNYHNAIIR